MFLYDMHRRAARALYIIAMVIVVFSGCGSEPQPIGAECSRAGSTLCEGPSEDVAGPCLLDLPAGMCSLDCSEDAGLCPEGYVCGDISDGRYCLQGCEEDGDCREDMICILGQCRGVQPFGGPCEDADDCDTDLCSAQQCAVECERHGDCPSEASCVGTGDGRRICLDLEFGQECEGDEDCPSGICYEGACNLECHDPHDCFSGLSCIDVGDGVPLCLEYEPPSGGEGRWGENCTFGGCDDGFDCMARTEIAEDDPNAYCTRSCLNELDCPADMVCRGTQLPDEDEVVARCVPREYCERCAYDGQCGRSDELCVSQNPRRGTGRYCSQSCDLERPVNTCPTDSTCHEALWCQADRAWVVDCEWCSESEQCGAPEGDPVAQCFHDYGACAGAGEDYCSPCFVDADCPEGGHCRFDPYMANSYCTMPCPEGDDGSFECPDEHYCAQVANDRYECLPRQGSCSQPSGGVTTCNGCSGFGDCVSGLCLPWDLSATGVQVCWEDCSGGPQECPPYTECYELTDSSTGQVMHLCGHHSDFRSCSQTLFCLDECPEGPSSCSDDAFAYCR